MSLGKSFISPPFIHFPFLSNPQIERVKRKILSNFVAFFSTKAGFHIIFFFIIVNLGNLQASYQRYPFLLDNYFGSVQWTSLEKFKQKKWCKKKDFKNISGFRIFDKFLVIESRVNSKIHCISLPPNIAQKELLTTIKTTIEFSNSKAHKKAKNVSVNNQKFLNKIETTALTKASLKRPPIAIYLYNSPDYIFSSAFFTPALLLRAYFALFPLWLLARVLERIQGDKEETRQTIAIIKKPFQNSKRLAQLAGIEPFLTDLQELVKCLRNKETKKLPSKGYLLVGPPGVGKTVLAQAIAGEAGVNFFGTTASEFQTGESGIGSARLRNLFINAEKLSPSIVFIDEIDTLGKARKGSINSLAGPNTNDNNQIQLFTEFLVQMDGFSQGSKVAFIGATNFVEWLDPAFIRPGRFDRLFQLELPTSVSRIEILKLHAGSKISKQNQETIPWSYFGQLTEGFSGADLTAMVNESLLCSIRKHNKSIHTIQSLQKGFERIATYSDPENKVKLDRFQEMQKAYLKASKRLLYSHFTKELDAPLLFLNEPEKNIRYKKAQNERQKNYLAYLPKKSLDIQLMYSLIGITAERFFLEKLTVNKENNHFWLSNYCEADLHNAYLLCEDMSKKYLTLNSNYSTLNRPYKLADIKIKWQFFWQFSEEEFKNTLFIEKDQQFTNNWRFLNFWVWGSTENVYSQMSEPFWQQDFATKKYQTALFDNVQKVYFENNIEDKRSLLQFQIDSVLSTYIRQSFEQNLCFLKHEEGLVDLFAFKLLTTKRFISTS
jgi:ATP-dependent 26S proteasome regulatory subunit